MMQSNILDVYQIIGKIGEGKGGTVYKAYHKNLHKEVVLKKIRSEIKDIINNRAEVDVLKNLRHSGLPQVLDFLEINGDVYTVMDYIPGYSFKQYLDGGTKFPESSVVIWMRQICATLSYLHRQKPAIIHGDLKPGNVMLMPNGNICLIDFNISLSTNGNSAWVIGYTEGYAAPEQISALNYNKNELDHSRWKSIDVRADIYSLGATIYHIMSGVKPKMDEDGFTENIEDLVPDINQVFVSIIMKCLDPRPARRYQNTEDLMKDLLNIHKKGKEYKALILKQRLTYLGVTAGTFLFLIIGIYGYFRMGEDKAKQYEQLVREESQCVTGQNFENFEGYYQQAVRLLPDRLDAYYQKALALHTQRQYGECIEYIEKIILGNQKIASDTGSLNNVYYLLGNAYEKMNGYQQAANCYQKAIEIKPDNSDYYRDYAIMLAYLGDTKGAEEALENAKNNHLDSSDINYVKGEILYSSQQYQEAKDIFLECVTDASSDYLKMRSYIMTVKCIDALEDDVSGYDEKIELLEKARKELPKENNIGILEQLAQTYSDMGSAIGDTSYYEKAIDIFKQIQNQGMGTYETAYNLAILYQYMEDYSMAFETLDHMVEVYGDDYRTYKRLAFLEAAKQENMAAEQRDYSKFQEYANKANSLYEQNLTNNENDIEMETLKDLYSQAAENGWITG